MPEEKEQEISFKQLFVSLTTPKAIFLIILLGLVVFSNSLFNGFVIDDRLQITENLLVHSISNILSFFTGSTFYSGSNQTLIGLYYRPLTMTAFSFIHTIFGPTAFWFHLFQISFHIANATLLFLFFSHFFKKPLSLILSLVFLVHPIGGESVFYISAMQEVLFFFFGILSMWTILHYKTNTYLLLGLYLLLSLFSGEVGLLFVVITGIYGFIFNRKLLLPVLGITALTVFIYFLFRINAVGFFTKPLNAPIGQLDLFGRLINIPAILFFYLKTFAFPLILSSSHQWVFNEIDFVHVILPLMIDVLFFCVIIFFAAHLYRSNLRKYFPLYTFFALWFFIGLSLHVQVVPLDSTVAERWFYFPIVGLLGMIGTLLEAFDFNVIKHKWSVLIVVLILLMSGRTMVRSFDWRNDFTLAIHDIKVSKDAYDIENRIAAELYKQGQFEEANSHAKRSVDLYPYLTNYNTLGMTYMSLGDYQKAYEAYSKALKFGQYYAVYDNLALLGIVRGLPASENIDFIQNAIKKFPQDAKLWLFLAIVEYENGSKDDAKIAIRMAHSLSKDPITKDVYYKITNDRPLNLDLSTPRK